jgi:hypothetical protein
MRESLIIHINTINPHLKVFYFTQKMNKKPVLLAFIVVSIVFTMLIFFNRINVYLR